MGRPARRSRSQRKRLVGLVTSLVVLLVFLLRSPASQPTYAQECNDGVVISLASTPERLQSGALQATLLSLLGQEPSCAHIWVWLDHETAWDIANAQAATLSNLVDARRSSGSGGRGHVLLRFANAKSPTAKYTFTLAALSWPREQWASYAAWAVPALIPLGSRRVSAADVAALEAKLAAGDAHILVVDDDQQYPTTHLASLLGWRRRRPGYVLSARGWRVRPDMQWGVAPSEYDHHVIEGWRVAEPYQVGVSTGNKGYLLRASFFRGLNLSDFSGAPPEALLVDDIWLNGRLAAAGVQRWVVPLPAAAADLPVPSSLTPAISRAKSSRQEANGAVLRHFQAAWEAENIPYRSGSEGAPRYKPFWQRAFIRAQLDLTELLLKRGWRL